MSKRERERKRANEKAKEQIVEKKKEDAGTSLAQTREIELVTLVDKESGM